MEPNPNRRCVMDEEDQVFVVFEFGLADALVKACEAKNVPIEVLHRLMTPQGHKTLETITRTIFADWQAEQSKSGESPKSPFSTFISYVQPEFEELKRLFPAYVNPDYKRVERFDPIERSKAVSRVNREVAFEYVHMDRDASADEVLDEMDRKGLRPALYEELLGFAEKFPDEQLKFPIVALGSEKIMLGFRGVAHLWREDDGRHLDLRWIEGGWCGAYRFLAVRE